MGPSTGSLEARAARVLSPVLGHYTWLEVDHGEGPGPEVALPSSGDPMASNRHRAPHQAGGQERGGQVRLGIGAVVGSQTGITVSAAAAARFSISAPSSVTQGVGFKFTMTVLDAYGNVVTGYRGTLAFSSSDATASLPKNYTFTASDQGVHTFTKLVLKKKGTQTITVTDTLNSSIVGTAIVDVL